MPGGINNGAYDWLGINNPLIEALAAVHGCDAIQSKHWFLSRGWIAGVGAGSRFGQPPEIGR